MDSAVSASLRDLPRRFTLWDDANKRLTRVLVRIANAVLELSHIDDKHLWEGMSAGCKIEQEREIAAEAVARIHAEARACFAELAETYAAMLSSLATLRSDLDSRISITATCAARTSCACVVGPRSDGSPAAETGDKPPLPALSLRHSALLLSDASTVLDVPGLCEGCARGRADLETAVRCGECVERLSGALRTMYGRELAVKEAVVRHSLPQSCVAAARRVAAVGAAPFVATKASGISSGVAAPSVDASPGSDNFSNLITPISSVVGLGARHPGLTPVQESDRDRLTALTAAVSMEVCIDAAERDTLMDALVLAMRSWSTLPATATRSSA